VRLAWLDVIKLGQRIILERQQRLRRYCQTHRAEDRIGFHAMLEHALRALSRGLPVCTGPDFKIGKEKRKKTARK